MKTFQRATLTAALLLICGSATFGQGMQVALLDVGYIFKNHPQFKQEMDKMKASVQSFETQLKTRQQQIEVASRQLSALKPGTQAYKDLESKTTKDLADLKVEMQLKRKEVMENEAEIYMATYKEVTAMVAAFAKAKKIDLVLRYDRESDPNKGVVGPQETLKIINRPVIFEAQLDISDLILRQLSATARK